MYDSKLAALNHYNLFLTVVCWCGLVGSEVYYSGAGENLAKLINLHPDCSLHLSADQNNFKIILQLYLSPASHLYLVIFKTFGVHSTHLFT